MTVKNLLWAVSPFAITLASCAGAATGEKAGTDTLPFAVETVAQLDEPWAMAFDQGTGTVFVTERKGTIRFITPDRKIGEVSGVPKADYGGQGGLGDIKFAPGQTSTTLDRRIVYLSWVEAGSDDTRGAVLGKADLICPTALKCQLENLQTIWHQNPKVTGHGHYSHRIAFSPDGQFVFVSSGDRQKFTPAQDLNSNLGKIVRLQLDGTPAPTNPFADKGSPADQIWSYGHRNVTGLAFDDQARLWDIEHGPKGGDELNLVEPGANYGWPLVSDGDHYDGKPIPANNTRPDLAQSAITWTPVITPGNFIFYSGDVFSAWKGQALVAGLVATGLTRVSINGNKAIEEERYSMKNRMRDIAQAPDGSIWLLEDGIGPESGHILRITPKPIAARNAN